MLRLTTLRTATAALVLTGALVGASAPPPVDTGPEVAAAAAADADLVVHVDRVDHIAQRVHLFGTAPGGSTIVVGDAQTRADAATGGWNLRVDGLTVGPNRVEVVRTLDGVPETTTVVVTVIAGGTLVPADGDGPVSLPTGGTTSVPVTIRADEARLALAGTARFTAPAGTRFVDRPGLAASVSDDGGTSWQPWSRLDLVDGVADAGRTVLTYRVDTRGSVVPAGRLIRYQVPVSVPVDAPRVDGELGYVQAGDSLTGDYRAANAVPTVVTTERIGLTARVDQVDGAAGTAALSGTATPGASLRHLGREIATADVTSGRWRAEITGLRGGRNPIVVEQFVDSALVDSVELVAELPLPDVPAVVTSPANGSTVVDPEGRVTFTGNGTVGGTITIMRGSDRIGSREIPGGGRWSITAILPLGTNDLVVHHRVHPGDPVTVETPWRVTVESGKADLPFAVDSPADGGVVEAPDKIVTFTGTGRADGTVTIMHGVRRLGSVTVPEDGHWRFSASMNYASYDLTTYYRPTPSAAAREGRHTVQVTAGDLGFAIVSPSDGATVVHPAGRVVVTGTGRVDGAVTVYEGSRRLGSTTVAVDGTWTLPVELTSGDHTLTVYYKKRVSDEAAPSWPLRVTVLR